MLTKGTRTICLAALALLISACGTTQQGPKLGAFPTFPAAGGGAGTVTSVSGTAPIGVATGTTTPVISIGNIPLTAMATQADQTALCNVSGGAASPIACSATQQRTMLGVQASSAVAITGGTIAGITAFNVAGTALYYDAAKGFIGIGTTSTQISTAGGAGLTIKGAATGGTGAAIELQRTTAAASANVGAFFVFNGASPTHEIDFAIDDSTVNSGKYIFYTLNGGVYTQTLTLRAKGNIQLGLASPATTATDGFPYIPAVAGTPTGVPTAITGYVPIIYDSTNNKFYIYNSGWKGGTTPGAFL